MSYTILVSGYGEKGKQQQDIAMYRINDEGKIVNKLCSTFIENASFLCKNEDTLFALSELDNCSKVFSLKLCNKNFIQQDSINLEGNGLCHISYSNKNNTLFGACYGSGHIFSISVKDNKFGRLCSFIKLGDKILDKDKITRAHCVKMDLQQKYLYAINIELDRIYVYTLKDGYLIPNCNFKYLQLAEGEGPRHILFHPNKNIAYIITEYSNKIFVLNYNKETGKLDTTQEISTLPDDFNGKSTGSTICFSNDTKFLYAANRGADSIATFQINENGTLTKKYDCSCYGNCPRHIDVTNDGKYLIIANQDSNEIIIAGIDTKSGKILNITDKLQFNKPSFILDTNLQ